MGGSGPHLMGSGPSRAPRMSSRAVQRLCEGHPEGLSTARGTSAPALRRSIRRAQKGTPELDPRVQIQRVPDLEVPRSRGSQISRVPDLEVPGSRDPGPRPPEMTHFEGPREVLDTTSDGGRAQTQQRACCAHRCLYTGSVKAACRSQETRSSQELRVSR